MSNHYKKIVKAQQSEEDVLVERIRKNTIKKGVSSNKGNEHKGN